MNKIDTCCIIDDDPISVFGIKLLIKQLNFCEKIIVYDNGEDAILGMKTSVAQLIKLPSLIILDLDMPIMDGWEFLEVFAEIPKKYRENVSVHILSSSVDSVDLKRAQHNKIVSDYVVKPITIEALRSISENFF